MGARTFVAVSFLLTFGSAARAGDDTAPRWIGTWSGKVTAKGCPVDGKQTVDLAISLTPDGALRSNGDLLEEGLGDLDWTADGKNLSSKREGFTASFKGSGKSAKLAVTTDGGCKFTGTLKRSSSGMPDCDRARAFATIKAQCNGLPSDTRDDDLADIDASWRAWSKLKGKKKKAQAAACKEQASTLEESVGRCYVGGTVAGTGIAECDALVGIVTKMSTCSAIDPYSMQSFKQALDQLLQSTDRQNLPSNCQSYLSSWQQYAQSLGCPI
jgi:hypothetical protein